MLLRPRRPRDIIGSCLETEATLSEEMDGLVERFATRRPLLDERNDSTLLPELLTGSLRLKEELSLAKLIHIISLLQKMQLLHFSSLINVICESLAKAIANQGRTRL